MTAGAEMYELVRELYPLCRSLTGDGVRETLRILARHVPLEIHEVPSGTQVFDWTVPRDLPEPLYVLMSAMQGENSGVMEEGPYYAPYPEEALT